MKKKLNEFLGKSLIGLVAFIMAVCSITSYVNAQQYQISAGERIKYPSWFDDSGTWSTRLYQVDGKIAYCLEASKSSPGDGAVSEGEFIDNENLQKVLYYGYGGPADTLSTDGITSAKDAYLLTHIAASYYYAGDLHGVNMEKLRGWGWAEWIESIPSRPAIPNGEIRFSKDNVKMYQFAGGQRSEELSVSGDEGSVISFDLASDMTLHNLTTNQTTQGKVQLTSGDRFYLSAPLSMRDNYNWSTGMITGTTSSYYRPVVLKIDDSTQSIGTMMLGSGNTNPTSLVVDFLPVGSLKLIKTNEDNQMLDGAVFNLKGKDNNYNQDHVVKNGVLQVENLLTGDYILTEIKTPADHDSLNKEYAVTIKANEITTKTIVNELRPSAKLIINKSLENKADDLSGIEFTVSAKEDIKDLITGELLYLAGSRISEENFVTDQEGKIEITNLPMGTYLVQEVKTIDGYILDNTIHEVVFTKEDNVTKEYEYVLDLENKLTTTLISKIDGHTKQPLSGAALELYLKDGDKLTLVEKWISNNEPYEIKGLHEDCEYVLKEAIAPQGYQLANDIVFTIENGVTKEIVMENNLIPIIPKVVTGDYNHYSYYLGLMVLSGLLVIITKRIRLQQEN